MNIDDFKGAWQSRDSAAAMPAGGDMKGLIARLDALEHTVRQRDLREYIAACFVIAMFGWFAARATEPLVRIGALIVVFGSMFIIVWSRRASAPSGRQSYAGDLPMAEFCARELARVDAQIRLLRSVWWWYLGPTVTGVLLMLLARPHAMPVKLGIAVLVLGLAALIYRWNVAAADGELEPLRAELARHLQELQRDGHRA